MLKKHLKSNMDRFIVKTASGTDVEKTFKIQYG